MSKMYFCVISCSSVNYSQLQDFRHQLCSMFNLRNVDSSDTEAIQKSLHSLAEEYSRNTAVLAALRENLSSVKAAQTQVETCSQQIVECLSHCQVCCYLCSILQSYLFILIDCKCKNNGCSVAR